MKIVKLVSVNDETYRNIIGAARSFASGGAILLASDTDTSSDSDSDSSDDDQPQVVTGQCHIFTGCNPHYALYPVGDTYQQCVARKNNSSTPHSWSSAAGCVDIP